MKFIKDIIGEKREQGPAGEQAAGQTSSQTAAAPNRDMLTAILAETRANAQSAAPLKLEADARVAEVPAEQNAVDLALHDTAIAAEDTGGTDALTAFLKERSETSGPLSHQPEQQISGDDITQGGPDQPLNSPMQQRPADGLVNETADLDSEPDGVDRPYRIFTRRNRTKILQLEAAAHAASQVRDGAPLVEDDAASVFGPDAVDHGPDEFLHVREDTRDEAGFTEAEDDLNTSFTDVLSADPVTRAAEHDSDGGVAQVHEPQRQVVAQGPQTLVTDPVPTVVTDAAARVSAVHPQNATIPAPEADSGPELGATFPEPAFAETAAAAGVDLGEPDLGLPVGRAGRVKTRLLGFDGDADAGDPFAQGGTTTETGVSQFPVGWLVVVDGPGCGAGFTLFAGVTVIGRGEGQTVRLDFGDSSISRNQHAAIAYDPEQQGFFIGHGGKANLVRRNGRPVLSTEALTAGDVIRVGETTLRFVPLCGPEFSWNGAGLAQERGAHFG